jgi:hypothetical protein
MPLLHSGLGLSSLSVMACLLVYYLSQNIPRAHARALSNHALLLMRVEWTLLAVGCDCCQISRCCAISIADFLNRKGVLNRNELRRARTGSAKVHLKKFPTRQQSHQKETFKFYISSFGRHHLHLNNFFEKCGAQLN